MLSAWRKVEAATTTLNSVGCTYRTLVTDVLRTPVTPQVALFLASTDNLEAATETYRVNGSWLALAAEVPRLGLNTCDQAAAIIVQAEAAEAEALASEKAAQIAANRHQHRLRPGCDEGQSQVSAADPWGVAPRGAHKAGPLERQRAVQRSEHLSREEGT